MKIRVHSFGFNDRKNNESQGYSEGIVFYVSEDDWGLNIYYTIINCFSGGKFVNKDSWVLGSLGVTYYSYYGESYHNNGIEIIDPVNLQIPFFPTDNGLFPDYYLDDLKLKMKNQKVQADA
jgi:hypothetical protein